MKDYDAYLFDWDGTLADSHPLWLEIVHAQLNRHGIHLTDQEIVKNIFGRYTEGMKELGFSNEELDRLGEESLEAGRVGMPALPLFAGAYETLLVLRKSGKKLGLITASYREVVDASIRNHGLMDLFGVIVTGDQLKAHKPNPEGILMALKALGVEPGHALMAGDSPKDLQAAKNAGTDSLLFCPPELELQHNKQELEACRPTYTIRSWKEALDQLQ